MLSASNVTPSFESQHCYSSLPANVPVLWGDEPALGDACRSCRERLAWHNNKRRKRLASAVAGQLAESPASPLPPRVTRHSTTALAAEAATLNPLTADNAALAAASSTGSRQKGSVKTEASGKMAQQVIIDDAAQQAQPAHAHPQVRDAPWNMTGYTCYEISARHSAGVHHFATVSRVFSKI